MEQGKKTRIREFKGALLWILGIIINLYRLAAGIVGSNIIDLASTDTLPFADIITPAETVACIELPAHLIMISEAASVTFSFIFLLYLNIMAFY